MIAWEAAAGPTVHCQGSSCARPAPPACGLDVLRWPGSLLPCEHGLLCARALTLPKKRKIAALQRDVDFGCCPAPAPSRRRRPGLAPPARFQPRDCRRHAAAFAA
jgi:hypothetical protein